MDSLNEKDIYNIVNKISGKQIADAISDIDIDEIDVSNKSIENIKNKTFKKLSLKPAKRKPSFKICAALASCLAVFMFAIINPAVAEQVKSIIQYVPGFNMIFSDNKASPERYVLQKPVESFTGDAQIKIKGAIVDSNSALFYITIDTAVLDTANKNSDKASASEEYEKYINNVKKNIVIKDAKGLEYSIDSYNASLGNNILVLLGHNGRIKYPQSLRLVFNNNENSSIAFTLTRVNSYNSFDELGPTDSKNGLSVTAVVTQDTDKTYFNLLCPTEGSIQIASFGIEDKKIKLSDESGKEYEVLYSNESRIGCLNEFYIYTKDIKGKKLNLSIPSIELKYTGNVETTNGKILHGKPAKIEFKIPDSSSIDINRELVIQGFPVNFKEVEKINNTTVRLYFDLYNSKKANEYLKGFSVANESFISKFNEKTGVLEYIEMYIQPSEKSKKIHLNNADIVKYGPWKLNIVQ